MFEITAFGAVGLILVIGALVASIYVDNYRERRDLEQLDTLLTRLGVAEGVISAECFSGDEQETSRAA